MLKSRHIPAVGIDPTGDDPDELLLGFLQETYAAAAELAKWDRKSLERSCVPQVRGGRMPDEGWSILVVQARCTVP
jgi:hypothetical protein